MMNETAPVEATHVEATPEPTTAELVASLLDSARMLVDEHRARDVSNGNGADVALFRFAEELVRLTGVPVDPRRYL